jgi:hypothetical protein
MDTYGYWMTILEDGMVLSFSKIAYSFNDSHGLIKPESLLLTD